MIIIGAKGFAKELLAALYLNKPNEDFVFYDDVNNGKERLLFNRYNILSTREEAIKYLDTVDNRYLLGIGNPLLRYNLFKVFNSLGGNLTGMVSENATIGHFGNDIGQGTAILNNVVIESDNKVGMGCLIHNAAFISHNVTIGDFCEISPSVNLLGAVSIGNFCSVGTNAAILPKIKIGNNVVIGAGAVVTKNIPDNCMAAGVPAVIKSQITPVKT